ncbi:hypothetical protein FB645_001707 [Coemansia sp. IMI 203386]|nr:hypothetical protein FB645_001707 [Coemansia sp. IMI 203386]
MSSQDNVDDIHGFFQFAQLSDSDSDSDGLFNKPRDRTICFDISKLNYHPKIDTDRWYDQYQLKPITTWLSEHFGVDEITYTAQRQYSQHQYLEAIDLCKQATLAFEEKHRGNLRLASIREILEIGGRAAMRVNGDVGFFYDRFVLCGGTNPGYSRFMAESLRAMQRFEEALEHLIGYLMQRKQDANIWELIGQTLNDISQSANTRDSVVWQQMSLGAYYKAHYIVDSCRTWAQTDAVIKQKKIQCEDLFKGALDVMRLLASNNRLRNSELMDTTMVGSKEKFWQQCREEAVVDRSQLDNMVSECSKRLRKSVGWILENLDKDQGAGASDEGDEEDAKNVDEL